jgi:transcriptional regulator with XRE-family HTH domain
VNAEPAERGAIGDLLAANLKRARAARGVSLSEAARLSGISKATLSQLESGTGNPTIETVASLAQALRVPLADLLERSTTPGMTVVRAAGVEPLGGGGTELRPYSRIRSGGVVCDLYEQVLAAGARRASRGHPGTEHTVVQAGTLVVLVDGARVELGPGDCVSFDASLPHVYEAPRGPVRSVLLLVRRGRGELLPPSAPH